MNNPDNEADKDIVKIPYSDLKDFALLVANQANMPYCWQSIIDRLHTGVALPFKVRSND